MKAERRSSAPSVKAGLSRFPVYDSDIDDIVGVLNTRDFLLNAQLDAPKPLRELLRPALPGARNRAGRYAVPAICKSRRSTWPSWWMNTAE